MWNTAARTEPEAGGRSGWDRAVVVFVATAVLAGLSAAGASTTSRAGTVTVGGVASRPNIVFVLTDDLTGNLLPYMPHVQKMMQQGATFTNYFVSDSLCCPSRTSIFTGLYPHDSGVFTNVGADGGMSTFNREHNPGRTFAVALQRSGYRTALMGKYLNGYEPDLRLHSSRRTYVPRGWDDWVGAGKAYKEFDYELNENHHVVHYGRSARAYLTDVLARHAREYIARAAKADEKSRQPFALEIATFAPHHPFVPAPRDRQRFPLVQAPRTPAFGTENSAGNPPWLDLPALTPGAIKSIDRDFRHRVRSVQAIDRMVGELRQQIRARGLASNTYFVFSSDNGYHMGEYRLLPGKETAFDTDIRVPLVITGPGIRPGMRIDSLAENIDLAPTFEELAGNKPNPSVDGRSLVPLLEGRKLVHWRRAVLIEYRGPGIDPDDPDLQEPAAGDPPSYDAIRLDQSVYVAYVDGEHEYYDIANDPDELRNVYAELSPAEQAELDRELTQLANCHGAAACHRADQLLPRS